MSRNFVILAVVALVACSLALVVGVAQATPLTINNASFEQNNYSAQSTGWTSFGPSGTQAVGWTGYWSSADGVKTTRHNEQQREPVRLPDAIRRNPL